MAEERSAETIVIAGGAGYIGRFVAAHYLSEGYRVIIVDRNEEETLRLWEENRRVQVIVSDVADPQKSRRTGEEIRERFGGVTHAISLIGGGAPGEEAGIAETPDETIEQCARINFMSHLFFLREMLPLIEADKHLNRSILFISSINAIQDYGRYVYGACKAGILGIVRSSATELGSKGIRINAILPGTCPNPKKVVPSVDYASLQHEAVLNRFVSPTEIAQSVYAFTHLMTAVTGQYLSIDCGQTISSAWLRNKYRA